MMSQYSAPPELMNDLVCKCSNGLCDEACLCFCNEQPCTTQHVCVKQQCHVMNRVKMKYV